METKKFKIGDKVRVKSLEWYNEKKNEKGVVRIDTDNCVNFTAEMSRLCGEIMQVEEMRDYFYIMNGSIFSWQDWMLEDEAVAEEKQEVEQLNKNDMETKEMTKEEVFAYLNNTKILCTSKEESEKVQKKLFELGLKWKTAEKQIVLFTFLFIIVDKKIQFTNSMEWWVKSDHKQIEPNEILAIQIKEEKPKFDPKTLQDFQKVLYRSSNADWWRLGFFEHYNEIQKNKFWIIGQDVQPYKQCVPYNDETKHLKGQSLDAPALYKIW